MVIGIDVVTVAVLVGVICDGAAVHRALVPVVLTVDRPDVGPDVHMLLLHEGLVGVTVHAPELRSVIGVRGAHIDAVLRGADGAQAVVGGVTEAVAGDGIEVDAVLRDEQVKAVFGLLGIVVAAEVEHKVVDRLVIDGLVKRSEDVLHGLAQGILQVAEALGIRGVDGDASLLGVVIGEGLRRELNIEILLHLFLESLVVIEHLAVGGDGVLIGRHVRGEARELLIERSGVLREQDVVEHPVQVRIIMLLQYLEHGVLQNFGAAADVGVVHIRDLTVGDLRELIGQCAGVIGADIEFTVVLAVAPDILVGVVAETRTEVADGAVGEVGVIVLAADLLEIAVRVHPVEIDGVIEVVIQQLEVAVCGHLGEVKHGIVVGAEIQIPVIDPHVAAHGVVDTETEAVAARTVVTDDLRPVEAAVGILRAAVHGEALLVDRAICGLVRHDRDIERTVILDDVPHTAAVEAVGLHDGGQAVEVVLIGDATPGVQTRRRVGAGDDDAAGSAFSVIVVGGKAHEDLAVVDEQAVHAIGHAAGAVDVVVGDGALVRRGVNLDERCGGAAHAGEIELAVELKGHAVAGQVVHARQIWGIAGENIGIVLENILFAEDDLRLAGVAVHGHDDGRPFGHGRLVEGVLAEHDLHEIGGGAAGVHVLIEQPLGLHLLERGLHVVVVDVIGGIVAGADVDIVTRRDHGPGIALAAILLVAGQDAVDRARTQRGVGDLVDGVSAIGVDALLKRGVADVSAVIPDNSGGGTGDQADCHHCDQHQSQKRLGKLAHTWIISLYNNLSLPLPSEIPSADSVYKAIMKFDVLQENSVNMLFFYKITKNTLYNLYHFTPCARRASGNTRQNGNGSFIFHFPLATRAHAGSSFRP